MKRILLICFVFLATFLTNAQEPLTIGEKHTIESKILNEERTLNIQLPFNFNPDSSYAVMYVLDGSAHEDFLHVVGLIQFFQLQMGMPEIIVVGIENVDRKRDFCHYTDDKELQKEFPTTGHSDKFMLFMETELQPYVESNFKTTNQKLIVGQSLGGLMATEFLLKKPELFTHYLIVSPSLWWDNNSLLNSAEDLLSKQKHKPDFVYVAVGAKEHPVMRRDAKSISKKLKKAITPNQKLYFNKMKDEDHATILHNALYEGLLKLYSPQKAH